ncbi:response regulator, partial [bacterium]|nr:response regulator [bacterium]
EREQLRVTLRSIGDAVITTDLDGKVVLMNRVAEQLTGWDQIGARGHKIAEIFEIFKGKTGEPARNPLDQAISQGIILELEDDTVLRSRNGQEFKIADSASPIRDEKSEIIGGVLVFRDITNRELMQEEVLKLRKLESVGRLAGGIAHDFNNLLTGIMGNVEVAAMRFESHPEKARTNLDKAMKASRRAADLTQKLLTFAKGGEPIKEAAKLNEIIRDSAEFSLLGSKIALYFEIPDDLWVAEVDSGQISQVIQNLVINAVHSMPEGGTISIRAENIDSGSTKTATLPLKPGAYVKISVRDQGCGIADELREKIFDPFFTTKKEGSGLGLSVTHSIVKKHGGYVGVQSDLGCFTEFSIFLPALGTALKTQKKVSPSRATSTSASRILVMDDEVVVREIITELLTTFNYEVEVASDGQQALEKYREQKFDLVIMDLTIPGGLGGRKTIELLKEFDPQVKAIVSSGYANDPVVAEYKKYGFCGFINKPYIIEDLLELIKKVLSE